MFSSNTSAVSADAVFVEDVMSCTLYTGNGSTQTITNGIDLAGKGGLVWVKQRSGTANHALTDTARGTDYQLASNSDVAQSNVTTRVTAFNADGFNLGASSAVNGSGSTYASWTFRKQPKFFDVVTFTTASNAGATVAHSLGSTPGFVIVKSTADTGSWICWHRGLTSTNYEIRLNTTAAQTNIGGPWLTVSSTQVVFADNTGYSNLAASTNYVMYVFAHDAGGFGLTGTDNVISCGSFTTDGSGNATVSLGYEPQWVLIKQTDGVDSWYLNDNMRGMAVSGNQPNLSPNSSAAESAGGYNTYPNATGFTASVGIASKNYIYIAIRRGPMKTPTSGTSVFSPNTFTTNNVKQTTGFPVDMLMGGYRDGGANWAATVSRLQGLNTTTTSAGGYPRLITSSTGAELSGTNVYYGYDNTGFISGGLTGSADNIAWSFRRAPGFFDVVCYTGTGSNRTVTHNLGVVPEMMIIKSRSSGYGWPVYAANPGPTKFAYLDDTGNFSANSTAWNDTAPTASVFTVGTGSLMNTSSVTYVAYLFASCPGVSKVGSYTGSGTTKQIDCGFTGGARFVLIKRTDDTGAWYVWDSARGIVAGNDPYLLLNSTAAEVTNTDYIDTYSAGFEISSTAPAAINANGGSFIFLAIA